MESLGLIKGDIVINNNKNPNNALVSVQKIIEETEVTDRIQTLLEYGNRCKLKSFKLRLVMESPEESMRDAKKSQFNSQNEICSRENN